VSRVRRILYESVGLVGRVFVPTFPLLLSFMFLLDDDDELLFLLILRNLRLNNGGRRGLGGGAAAAVADFDLSVVLLASPDPEGSAVEGKDEVVTPSPPAPALPPVTELSPDL
jgi:hypothetical protein